MTLEKGLAAYSKVKLFRQIPHIPHLGSCDDWGDLYLDQDAKTSYPDLPNTGFGISELFNAHCIASTQNTEE